MIQRSSARGRARVFGSVGAALAVLGVFAACSLTPRANGEGCLKSEDCLSGLCVQSQCRAAPTLLDAETDGPGSDASSNADGTSGDSATPTDSGKPMEAAAKDSGTKGGDSSTGTEAGGGDSSAPEAGGD